MTAHNRSDKISPWMVQLLTRVGWQKAVVALANAQAERPEPAGRAKLKIGC